MDKDVNVEWLPFKEGNNFLIIDDEFTIQKDANKDRMTFWAQLYGDILEDYLKLFLWKKRLLLFFGW